MTIYTSNSFSSIFIRILPEYFPIPLSRFKRGFHSKHQNLLKRSLSSILFVFRCRPSIFRSNTPFWRSNTALDGPLINQSNRLFLSGYAIMNDMWYIQYFIGFQYSFMGQGNRFNYAASLVLEPFFLKLCYVQKIIIIIIIIIIILLNKLRIFCWLIRIFHW